MKEVHVVIGEYKGNIDVVKAFNSEYEAEKFAIDLEEKYNIPLASDERDEYYESPEANYVRRYELEVE
nr:hypothetical protein [uncultured archaeon]